MRIIGIDPGLANVGYGVLEVEGRKVAVVTYGVIRTRPNDPLCARLAEIQADVSEVCRLYGPTHGAMEKMTFMKPTEASRYSQQGSGAAGAALGGAGLVVDLFTPQEWKAAIGCGGGESDKDVLAMAVRVILGLERMPRPSHAADALGLAITLAQQRARTLPRAQ